MHKPWSLIAAVTVLLLLLALKYLMILMMHMPPCQFHTVTGWHCPGCGGRRSVAALVRGDVLTALRMNALLIFLAIILFGIAMRLIQNEWRTNPQPQSLSNRTLWVIFVAVVSFWILRNIPHWPFRLLAPL